MPQLDKSTCIVQIYPVMALILLVLLIVWFGNFLYMYIFGHGREFLYVLGHFMFYRFGVVSSVGSVGGVQYMLGRYVMHNIVPSSRKSIEIRF